MFLIPRLLSFLLSLCAGSNITKVMFGVDPLQNDSKISSTDQSLIRGLFGSLVVNDSSLRLTKSLFGDAFSFEVLKFPGGITIIPPQSVFLLQKVRIPFNFTLNFSIFQTRENFAELKSQLMTGLHLTTRENLYINLWNSQGSTVAPPTTVLSSVILVIGNTPRLKQLAQTIRGHSKNLGLNNTVFGKVKQVRLSSILQHSLHGGEGSAPSPSPTPLPTPPPHPPPTATTATTATTTTTTTTITITITITTTTTTAATPMLLQFHLYLQLREVLLHLNLLPLKSSPAPHNSNGAKPPGCQFGCKRNFTGNGRKGSHLAPSNAPSSSHFSATSPQPDNGPPSVSPTPSQISQTIPVSSPLPNVVFAHAQPPSGGKPKEHSDTMLPVSPSPAPSSCLLTVQWSIVLSLAALVLQL
ncbi:HYDROXYPROLINE-RICH GLYCOPROTEIN FAMILY PROTEIN [Salix purpurea]|uniref:HYDROXYPROLINE-RICH GLYCOPROTEIN FAMILY PROTEIN n=1 Tax=Salix purpurea TaxID=77065 RepID=A0A9Q0T4B7_SALPP|nr:HYDROXYPROLINE-RICH GLYCOPROTEIN FAMILY PROTEIN [Salix purpurea]